MSSQPFVPSDPTDCIVDADGDRCRSYRPGHQMHFIHAKKLGEEPWGWRDGVVVSVSPDGWLEVDYVLEPGRVVAHHHEDLTSVLHVGEPVRIHERFYGLSARFGWVNLCITDGLGWVPEPEDPELWQREITIAVTDLSTGRALPMDRLKFSGEER